MLKQRIERPKAERARGKKDKQENLFKYFNSKGASRLVESGKLSSKKRRKVKDGKGRENCEGKSIKDFFKAIRKNRLLECPVEKLNEAPKEALSKKEKKLKPKIVKSLEVEAQDNSTLSFKVLLEEMMDAVELSEKKGIKEKREGKEDAMATREPVPAGILGKRSQIDSEEIGESVVVEDQARNRKKVKKSLREDVKESNQLKTQKKKRKIKLKEIIIKDVLPKKNIKKSKFKNNLDEQTLLIPKRKKRKSRIKKILNIPMVPSQKMTLKQPIKEQKINDHKVKISKNKNKKELQRKALKIDTINVIKDANRKVITKTCSIPAISCSTVVENIKANNYQEVIITKTKIDMNPAQDVIPVKPKINIFKTPENKNKRKKDKPRIPKKKDPKPKPSKEPNLELLKLVYRIIEEIHKENQNTAITHKNLATKLASAKSPQALDQLPKILQVLSYKNKIFITSDNGNIYKL